MKCSTTGRARGEATAEDDRAVRSVRRKGSYRFKREDDARERCRRYCEALGSTTTFTPRKRGSWRLRAPKDKPRDGDDDGSEADSGFTHHWARSTNGYWVVMLKTAKSRFSTAVKGISEWCRRFRHLAVADQCTTLTRKLRGHYNYFGVVGNGNALWRFSKVVYRTWRSWLNRRSQRARMTWQRMRTLIGHHPLPAPDVTKLRSLR